MTDREQDGVGRRNFVGACFAGLAGVAAAGALGWKPAKAKSVGLLEMDTMELNEWEEVSGNFIIPKKAAPVFEAGENQPPVVITTVPDALKNTEFLSILGTSTSDRVWYGISHQDLLKIDTSRYAELIKAHQEVNRAFGFRSDGSYRAPTDH